MRSIARALHKEEISGAPFPATQERFRRRKTPPEKFLHGLGLHFIHQHLPYGLLGWKGTSSCASQVAGDFLPIGKIMQELSPAGFIASAGGKVAPEEEEDDKEASPASSEGVRRCETHGVAAGEAEPSLVCEGDFCQFSVAERPEATGVVAVGVEDRPGTEGAAVGAPGLKEEGAVTLGVAARRKNAAHLPERRRKRREVQIHPRRITGNREKDLFTESGILPRPRSKDTWEKTLSFLSLFWPSTT